MRKELVAWQKEWGTIAAPVKIDRLAVELQNERDILERISTPTRRLEE
jgi:hypothetical protein